jgi:hypothetical protein
MAKLTNARNAAMIELFKQGYTHTELATKYDLSRQRVYQIVGKSVREKQTVIRVAVLDIQRINDLKKILTPLIKAGLTRAEIIRHQVSGIDVMFMETHAPDIFKDHRQYILLKKYGVSEKKLEQLAAQYGRSWIHFKSKFDVARNAAVTKRKQQWQLSFIEWFTLWSQSGAWQLGNINEYPRHAMVLMDTDLPYEIGNVRIVPMSYVAMKGWLKKHRRDPLV